jgi:hypothetical protein
MLYVYTGAVPAVTYYARRGMAELGNLVMGGENPDKYLEELNTLRSAGTVWVIFSHVDTNDGFNDESFMLRNLDSTGTRLVERRTVGASLYQYRLAPATR